MYRGGKSNKSKRRGRLIAALPETPFVDHSRFMRSQRGKVALLSVPIPSPSHEHNKTGRIC